MNRAGRQCVILIGGRGTRLGRLVATRPKPLLEVGGRPFLDHLLAKAVRCGFSEAVLLAGYRADVVEQRYGRRSGLFRRLGIRLDVIVEPRPMGTGGALANAQRVLAPEFLLLNGDSWFDFHWPDLAAPKDDEYYLATVALRPTAHPSRYGVVELKSGRIVGFHEKPTAAGPSLVNGGVYWLRREICRQMNDGPVSLETELFPALAASGALAGRVYDGAFIDIGVPKALARARADWRRFGLA